MKPNWLAVFLLLACAWPTWAQKPDSLFDEFWSAQCLNRQGGLVSEYSVFTADEWCLHIADTWRTHSMCRKMTVEPLADDKAILKVEGAGRYRAEWTGTKLILEPLDGGEREVLAPAVRRNDDKDRFLTCPP